MRSRWATIPVAVCLAALSMVLWPVQPPAAVTPQRFQPLSKRDTNLPLEQRRLLLKAIEDTEGVTHAVHR